MPHKKLPFFFLRLHTKIQWKIYKPEQKYLVMAAQPAEVAAQPAVVCRADAVITELVELAVAIN